MWRESLSKQATLMESVSRVRDQVKQKATELSEKVLRIEGLMQDQDFKIGTLIKQFDLFQQSSPSLRDSPS